MCLRLLHKHNFAPSLLHHAGSIQDKAGLMTYFIIHRTGKQKSVNTKPACWLGGAESRMSGGCVLA